MSFTFPLTLADFGAGLRVRTLDWDLSENISGSRDGAGRFLTSEHGPRLWRGALSIAPDTHDGQRRAQALAQVLRQAGASFLFGDPKGRFPIADPAGALLGGALPTLIAPVAGADTISLAGLPAGYELTTGDYLSFAYGEPATKRALHQVTAGGQSDADGNLTVGAAARLRPGAVEGAAVSLIRPVGKFVMVPGSFKAGRIGLASTEGFSFSFIQTTR